MQLETVADLKRAALALRNTKSRPWEYAVRTFGYCHDCRQITEYKGFFHKEGSSITCLSCKKLFESYDAPITGYSACFEAESELSRRSADSKLLEEFRSKMSRKCQRGYFMEILEEKISSIKSQQRKMRSELKELAKLRY